MVRRLTLAVVLGLALAGCGDDDESGGRPSADDFVRLNQIQVLGSHNSFHIQPRPTLLQALLMLNDVFQAWEYTHLPLDQQFATQGVRQIELDVFADPQGGLYAMRRGLIQIGEDPSSGEPALDEPGFKVLHIQDVDFETTCLTFVACLETVKAWSDANPRHLPLMILVEAKDDPISPDFAIPVEIDTAEFRALDAEIRSVFPATQLITPDDVRQGSATLREAVLTLGWPTLRAARGRVLFALDNGGAKGDAYRDGHTSLEGLVLFTNASPGDPDAAFVKRNDAIGDEEEIRLLVQQGYLVRTRTDADTMEARRGDTSTRDAALESGAQFVSTDYPVENPAFGTGYFVAIPGGSPARCNPINAPPECDTATLE